MSAPRVIGLLLCLALGAARGAEYTVLTQDHVAGHLRVAVFERPAAEAQHG